MNLAFQLKDDKSLTKEDFEPYKIVSLWDMLNFYGQKWLSLCVQLTTLTVISRQSMRAEKQLGSGPPLPDFAELLQLLSQVNDNLQEMELTSSVIGAERLINYLKQPTIRDDYLKQLIDDFLQKMADDLMAKPFLVVKPSRTIFYDTKGTFLGDKIIGDFSELIEDACEAGNCFALGRYTACVFHLMRVMEVAVQTLAIKVRATKKDGSGLDLKNEEWYQIERAIARAIETMTKGELKDKYSASLASLSAVRAGWRNPTMHPKKTYTEEEARILIDSVKLFVEAVLALP